MKVDLSNYGYTQAETKGNNKQTIVIVSLTLTADCFACCRINIKFSDY
nr:hypothetical protein [Mycoplasmopsis bovis]